ncbi:von willebrand factor d and egf domain-containing hypothetical protein [Limosa lapponica baueri]|uniref:Uncharacterized protein n=1 Tax=Limosa lapponica baueri TaxID=1758121 RepID=A0A2I0T7J3_LIMLA|nr:von willebrand factor d and egf domain-containing hypothetical protein [Limosa lapponica baueri]
MSSLEVYCSSSAFFVEKPDIQSASVESKEFFAGIKIHPETYDISEDGKEYRLAIESSIPIPCPEFSQLESDCKISLTLNTVDEGSMTILKQEHLFSTRVRLEILKFTFVSGTVEVFSTQHPATVALLPKKEVT